MKPDFFPDAVRRRLTSLFPAGLVDDLTRKCEVVERHRTLDVTMFVWTLIAGFAAGGEARSIAAYRRSYNAATGHELCPSSFYDRLPTTLLTFLATSSNTLSRRSQFPTISHQLSTDSAMWLQLTLLLSDCIDSSQRFQQRTRESLNSNSILSIT